MARVVGPRRGSVVNAETSATVPNSSHTGPHKRLQSSPQS